MLITTKKNERVSTPMTQKKPYKYWSEEQKHKLLEYVRNHTDSRGKISWFGYNNHIPGKTSKQCKSYYFNVLTGKQLTLEQALTKDEKQISQMTFEAM